MGISRKEAILKMGAAAGSASLLGFSGAVEKTRRLLGEAGLRGNINHAVTRWPYGSLSLDELCQASVDMGIKGIELVGPDDWAMLKEYDLYCPMCNGAEPGIDVGFIDPEMHSSLYDSYSRVIPLVAEAGFENLICFSGNTPEGMDEETGLRNFVEGIKPLLREAEQHGVVLCLEMFNTRVDHPGYMANSTRWAVDLCDRLGSENFKLLYDIYHMQIMEGDIISRIREYGDYFAHYHTGGVPGRNEIDETQELNYPAIMQAIVDTGFDGYVGQEFIPSRDDDLASLKQGIEICDV
ncbi:MAG: TIM barrel protein [Balneolaceae bacterium]|nr:TIM barrel protein [Balneolaceae bacterium]